MVLAASDYQPYHDDAGVATVQTDSDITTPLPVPGEYILLQLNPVAMAKHLCKPSLSVELRKLESKKYLAVFCAYLEAVSPVKPWHIVQVLLYHDQEDLPLSEVDDAQPLYEHMSGLHTGSHVTVPQNRKSEKKQMLQVVVVRLRTRLCELPRAILAEVPEDTYDRLRWFRYLSHEPGPVELLQRVTSRGPRSPLWSYADQDVEYNPAECQWEGGTELHRLCLLPHCDYSFDLNSEVEEGIHLLEEHKQIVALLAAAISHMPLKAQIPVTYEHDELRKQDFSVEPRVTNQLHIWSIMYEHGLPDWMLARRERARRRKEANKPGWFASFFRTAYDLRGTTEVRRLVKAAQDIEIARSHLLLFAPPGLSEVSIDSDLKRKLQATRLSLFEMVAEFWLGIREAILAWWSPSSVYMTPVDDVPYIPFAEWHKLLARGLVNPNPPPSTGKNRSWELSGYVPPPPAVPIRHLTSDCVCF